MRWRRSDAPSDDERMARPEPLLTPRFGVVVASGLAYFMSLGMLLPVIPRYVEHRLGGGSVGVGIAIGALFVGALVLRPYAGRIGDRFGRRRLIVAGASVVGVAALLYGAVPSLGFLIGARLLAGVGEAAFFVGAATMITDLAPAARRGEAISYWSVAVYGGLAFGPALGEQVNNIGGYGTTWLVSAALAGLAALLGACTREVARPAGEASGASVINRAALVPGTVLFSGLIALAAFTAFVPLYVDQVGLSGADTVFLAYGGLVLVVRIVGARLPDQLGGLRAGAMALLATTSGMTVMATWKSIAGLFVGTVLFAAGASLLYPALLLLALGAAPDTERASVVGTFSSFFDLSQAVGSLLVGGIAAVTSYQGAFGAGAVFAVAGLVALPTLTRRRLRSAELAEEDAFVAEHPAP
jgi:MFS family permease